MRLATLLIALISAFGCRSNPEYKHQHIEGEIFGTHYQISYSASESSEKVKKAIEEELHRIDSIASSWRADSEVEQYEKAENKSTFRLSDDLAYLLEKSEEIKTLTDGAFDIHYKPGEVDLSGIAKGYAVDQISDLLEKRFHSKSYLIEIGGEIRARGDNPNGKPWSVGIYNPLTNESNHTLEMTDSSVATSGNYLRGNHIFDPSSGTAASDSLLSVSVIHTSNTMADAIATALYVMGPERGPEWAKSHDIHAIFIMKDGMDISTD